MCTKCDWTDYYQDTREAIPINAPEPKGKEVDTCMFVYSDHARDKKSQRSKSGLLIYIITALLQWYSKKQSTVEISEFGAELVAMKQGIGDLRGFRYELRMKCVSISCPSYIFEDNMSLIHNVSRLVSAQEEHQFNMLS